MEKTYKGQKLVAWVDHEGRVIMDNKPYDSLSAAARAAVSLVGGGPHDADDRNGWEFWQFRDADNQLREMNVLRQRYANGKRS